MRSVALKDGFEFILLYFLKLVFYSILLEGEFDNILLIGVFDNKLLVGEFDNKLLVGEL